MKRAPRMGLVVSFLLGCAVPALAEDRAAGEEPPVQIPVGEERIERARQLFREASELGKRGDWPGALAHYERSAELVDSASTRYNIGFCSMKLGDVVSAWYWMQRALDAGGAPTGPAPLTPDRAADVRDQLAQLSEQLAQVRIELRAPTHVEVDGKPLARAGVETVTGGETASGGSEHVVAHERGGVPPGGWQGSLIVLVIPGKHSVRFADVASGAMDTREVGADVGQFVSIVWPEVTPEPDSKPAVPSPAEAARVETRTHVKPAPPARPPRHGWVQIYPVVQWTSVGVLAAGGVTAAVGAAVYLTADRKLEGVCDEDGICPDELQSVVDRHRAAGVATNVGIWTAAAGGIAAAAILAFRPKSSSSDLAIEVNAQGIFVHGRF